MQWVREHLAKFIKLRRELHQIPELGYAEYKTQQKILDYLKELPKIEVKKWRTGILVHLFGSNPKRRIAFRADIDALPLKEQTGLNFSSEHPGCMHACGHDMHMAIAVGVLSYFAYHPLQDDLLFIFQPAEEGPGGAKPMLASAEFKKWQPDQIYALHVLPEAPVATISTRPGVFLANTAELIIELIGAGGHAAQPHLGRDMIVAQADLVLHLKNVIATNIDPMRAAVLTIGQCTAGTANNVMADNAVLRGGIRALDKDIFELLKKRVTDVTLGMERIHQCKANVTWKSEYVQTENNANLTAQFMSWAKQQCDLKVITADPMLWGEDFGYFLQEIPGLFFTLGVNSPYGLHHAKFNPDENAILVGIELVCRFFKELIIN
ncbi:MAG: hypothetical protein RLZ12_1049 [Bacillota bacterium]